MTDSPRDIFKCIKELPDAAPKETLTCKIKVITPIFGGGAEAMYFDKEELIRAPEIRGHLRFWWRALNSKKYNDVSKLLQAEQEIWGGTAYRNEKNEQTSIQSQVDVSVAINDTNSGYLQPENRKDLNYALFPAIEKNRKIHREHNAEYVKLIKDVEFNLTLTWSKKQNADLLTDIKSALTAWILFGGYGARVRRGLGSLKLVELKINDKQETLLHEQSNNGLGFTVKDLKDDISIKKMFGGEKLLSDIPQLNGARLLIGDACDYADDAWYNAINWLCSFRQSSARPGYFPRPGQSNWPEPYKMRQLCAKPRGYKKWEHDVLKGISQIPAWPRASFGLPIIIQFQDKDRNNNPYTNPEPGFIQSTDRKTRKFSWSKKEKELSLKLKINGKEYDRFASPLIIKAMALGNGKYAPIALWLNNNYPQDGSVALFENKIEVKKSEAQFDVIAPLGDPILYSHLTDGRGNSFKTVKEAFLNYLINKFKAKEVF